MKKITSIATLLLVLFLSNNAFAKIWRVNNTAGVVADFTTVAAAVTAASAGDTIHVEPSASSYGTVNLTKQLVLIGNGYTLSTVDTGLQANTNTSTIGQLTFSAGSANSIVEGLVITGYTYVQDQNITERRCWIQYPVNIYNSNFTFTGNDVYYYSLGNNASNLTGLNIYNNIFYYYSGISFDNTCTGSFYNNDCNGSTISCYNFQVNNNILYTGAFSANNNVYFNNIATGTQFGNANGNQQNVAIASVITMAGAYQDDQYWKLSAGSLAIGAGYNGVDCGATGGPNPYKFGGLPNVPSIYSLTVPPVGTSTISVTVSTKSNN